MPVDEVAESRHPVENRPGTRCHHRIAMDGKRPTWRISPLRGRRTLVKRCALNHRKRAGRWQMPGPNKLTKSQIIAALAEGSGLDKKAVSGVLEALNALIKKELSSAGPGEMTIPNLVKLKAKQTPATEDR